MERYGKSMIQSAVTPSEESVEAALRRELAQGDAMLRSVVPVLRHLLAGAQHPMFADEVVARVRGQVADVARQLLDAVTFGAGGNGPASHGQAALDSVTDALIALPGFLEHAHALALEWQLTDRFQAQRALDPVLPPLLQALLASDDATTSALAMNLLAAQARFAQTQRRMQLPLNELPADLLHGALLAMHALSGAEAQAATAEAAIRAGYDESRTRLGLIARLVTGMGGGAVAALALDHAGVAIFAMALAITSGQERDAVVLSTSAGQGPRFALALRATGLKQTAIDEQMVAFHPGYYPSVEWDRLGTERAAEILAVAARPGDA